MQGCQWEAEIERELRGPLGNSNGPLLQSYHSNSGPATTPAAENCGTVVLFGGMYVEWHQVRTSSTVVGCGAAADEVGGGAGGRACEPRCRGISENGNCGRSRGILWIIPGIPSSHGRQGK